MTVELLEVSVTISYLTTILVIIIILIEIFNGSRLMKNLEYSFHHSHLWCIFDIDFRPIDVSSHQGKELLGSLISIHVTEVGVCLPISKSNWVISWVRITNRLRLIVRAITILLVQGMNLVHHLVRDVILCSLIKIDIAQLLDFIMEVGPFPSAGALQTGQAEILLVRSLINILSLSVWLDCCPLPSNIVELEDVNNLFADELLNRIRLQFDRANTLAALAEL